MGSFLTWLPEGILITLLTLAAGLLGWFGKAILAGLNRNSDRTAKMYELGWEQAAEKDREIIRLKSVIERLWEVIARGRRRENAYATGCELLLIAMPSAPTLEQVQLVTRARQLFETAIVHSDGGRGSG